MHEIDTLLEVFPDARIIQLHRDPIKAIPSFCSLMHMYRKTLEGSAAKPGVLGPHFSSYWRKGLDCMLAARRKSSSGFVDVDQRDFLADPLGTVRTIYEHLSLTLAPHTEQQMRTWVANCPTSRFGKHEYSVESWGLTSDQIGEEFAGYRSEFGFN